MLVTDVNYRLLYCVWLLGKPLVLYEGSTAQKLFYSVHFMLDSSLL